MARKNKEEKYFEVHKQTISECLNDGLYGYEIFEEDKIFVLLLIAGFSAAYAYRTAYDTSATNASSAVLASRRVREPQIQRLLSRVFDCAESGLLYISQKAYKGKKRKWPAWMGKKVNNIDSSPI